METADLASLTAWLERLKANNRALQELNVEIEDHISEQDLVAEYTTVTEYDDEAIRMMALLDCKTDSLRHKHGTLRKRSQCSPWVRRGDHVNFFPGSWATVRTRVKAALAHAQ
ncbi:hypothetical protein HPB47_013603 [Ixodes persulcatus]|uniref:Uncharacterized protein n=1 Tax=Ixodes persulcatus TaxID=34615 RepID=A0AC60R1A8_IXOPE|nr:hypothetical protein HPB47_013603 [Ixodes persulcatus]